jgi:hypothetical protein
MESRIITRRESQFVVERDGLKDSVKLMKSVCATAYDAKSPVNLGKRWERESGLKHFGRLTSSM